MKLRMTAALGLTAALMLTGCGNDETQPGETTAAPQTTTEDTAAATPSEGTEDTSAAPAGDLNANLSAGGASSMKAAQNQWVGDFAQVQPNVKINYTDSGSGAGRDSFTSGAYAFAGSDRAFKVDENKAGSFAGCADSSAAIDVPVYISPIAIVYNIPGVDNLNLTPAVAAGIFKGDITKWNDEKIAADNAGVELPDTNITVVHRKDKSGTTENFTDWLNQAAGDVWTEKADQVWKGKPGEAVEQTSGMVQAVQEAEGSIGYADLSQVPEGMGKAKVNDVEPSAADASKAVEASELETEGRAENDLSVKVNRTAEGYPIVLISYAIGCAEYKDKATGDAVRAYFEYMVSDEAQKAAEQAVGSAALPEKLAEKAKAAASSIK